MVANGETVGFVTSETYDRFYQLMSQAVIIQPLACELRWDELGECSLWSLDHASDWNLKLESAKNTCCSVELGHTTVDDDEIRL